MVVLLTQEQKRLVLPNQHGNRVRLAFVRAQAGYIKFLGIGDGQTSALPVLIGQDALSGVQALGDVIPLRRAVLGGGLIVPLRQPGRTEAHIPGDGFHALRHANQLFPAYDAANSKRSPIPLVHPYDSVGFSLFRIQIQIGGEPVDLDLLIDDLILSRNLEDRRRHVRKIGEHCDIAGLVVYISDRHNTGRKHKPVLDPIPGRHIGGLIENLLL